MEIMDAKPPYVQFEVRAVEDVAATRANGHYTSKDVNFALITPSGSHDCVEKRADTWLSHIEQECQNGRFPANWVDYYRKAYERWQQGLEIPLEGTPLRDWPGLSPAMLKNLQGANIRTVEDLANANEEALHRMGMGSRGLKARAQAFLSSSQDVGKVAEEVAALRLHNEKLEAANKALEARLSALEPKGKAKPEPAPAVDLDEIIKEG